MHRLGIGRGLNRATISFGPYPAILAPKPWGPYISLQHLPFIPFPVPLLEVCLNGP